MSTRTSPTPPHAEYFPPTPARRERPRWWSVIGADIEELKRYWPVVSNMVVQDLRVRYQRSLLGFFWSLLHPILMMSVMTVVFARLLGRTGDWQSYAIYLFSGQLPWFLLVNSLNDCAFSIIQNEGLIRKIYIPKLIFPLSRVLFNLVTFALSLVALFLLLIPLGARLSWAMLALPLSIGLLAAFVFGLGLFVSVINTFYRDCGHLMGVVLQAWFFATPILYEADRFQNHTWFLALNPAYAFIRQFHMIIRDGIWPDAATIAISLALVALSVGVGYATYKSHESRLVFRL